MNTTTCNTCTKPITDWSNVWVIAHGLDNEHFCTTRCFKRALDVAREVFGAAHA